MPKDDMTAYDPMLDQSQKPSAGPLTDAREVAFLRHDIDRALAAVLAGLGGVAAADLDERTREIGVQSRLSARTLSGLVRAMGGESPVVEEVGVRKLASRMGAIHAAEARARGLELVVETDDDLPATLRIDRITLLRILDNLVDNAMRFSCAGTVRLAVSRNAAGEIVFRVTDEGPGLAAAGGATDAGTDNAGAGEPRGLDIAHVLAARLGAAISIGDRPGGGTEAVLRLPGGAGGGVSASLSGARILLAEDNLTNQMVALQMLRALGASVTICSDGVEALERFGEGPFDLVIVDIEMPRMSGLDVIRTIRSRGDAKARVPIVALTAYAMREHRERIAAAGANGLISKPVTSIEALGESLALHLAQSGENAATAVNKRAATAVTTEDAWDGRGPVIDAATYAALGEAIGAELMAELLDKVIADLLAAQRDLAAGATPVDRHGVRSASHILISVAGALGALRLQACARALNGAAHTEAEATLAEAVAGCAAEIDLAVAFARERRGAL